MINTTATTTDSLLTTIQKSLQARKKKSRLRQLTTFETDNININNNEKGQQQDLYYYVDFSSNDFLSLATNKTLYSIFLAELKKCRKLGSGGSRLLDGNSHYVESLETQIAKFHRAPAGLIFNSGFDANVSVYSCLPQPGDVVVYDEYIHASAHDGMRQGRAKDRFAFRHNIVDDGSDDDSVDGIERYEGKVGGKKKDLRGLKQVLIIVRKTLEKRKNVSGRIFIGVESVYSMDGDVAKLKEMLDCAKQVLSSMEPQIEYHFIVDEAHATGVVGNSSFSKGKGLVNDLNLETEISIRVHTFGKALSASGSIVFCHPIVREYLINYARPFIYSTALPYYTLAAIKASYEFLGSSEFSILHRKLWENIQYLHDEMVRLFPSKKAEDAEKNNLPMVLYKPEQDLHGLAQPSSAIFSLLCPGDADTRARSLAKFCQTYYTFVSSPSSRKNFVVRPIVYPTVPKGTERIRICVHTGNSFEDIDDLLKCISDWVSLKKEEEEGNATTTFLVTESSSSSTSFEKVSSCPYPKKMSFKL